jgi:hypothetical protein
MIAAATFGAAPAAAHGPCGCLRPAKGAPGVQVREVGTTAVRVLWNPARVDLPLGPPALWARHRPGATAELFAADRPARGVRFRIPDTRAGTYLVATFDGSEGGSHYTWDFVRVSAEKESRAAYDLIFWLTIAGGGALLTTAFVLLRPPRL